MKWLILIAALAPNIALATCPPVPDRTSRHIELLDLLASAQNETQAREWSNELWGIWATAPDAAAQEILRRGMERRAAYDFKGALEDFDTLVDYCPDYAEGYNQRAFVNFIRQNYEASLEDLELALQITPDHIGALSGKALTLMQMGRQREGQIILRQALLLNPWLPERHRVVPLDSLPSPDREL